MAVKGKKGPEPQTNGAANGHANGADAAPEIGAETAKASTAALASKTLLGDLRDAMMTELRDMPEIWKKMTEQQQKSAAQRLEDAGRRLIDRAVEILAAGERVTVGVMLEQVTFKPKGSDAKIAFLGLSRELKHALVDAQGSRVLIVVADATQHMGARRPAKIDKQEPALPPVEARSHGREDGIAGNRAHQELYPEGHANRADYDAGWNDGQKQAVEKQHGGGTKTMHVKGPTAIAPNGKDAAAHADGMAAAMAERLGA